MSINAARQQPLFLLFFLLLQGKKLSWYSSVTWTNLPSCLSWCLTMCLGKNPTRHWSIPSETQKTAIADSSLPPVITCTFLRRRTTSSTTTQPHTSWKEQDLPLSLDWSPTTSTTSPTGWKDMVLMERKEVFNFHFQHINWQLLCCRFHFCSL